jgi:hypothetical protein
MKQKCDSSSLATKGYLSKSINNLLRGIRREFNFAFEIIEEKLGRKLTKHTNPIFTAADPLLKELEARREDREIAFDQSARIKNRIDNHEKRIKILESA